MEDSVAAFVNRIEAKSSAFRISCSFFESGTGVPDQPDSSSGNALRERWAGTGLWSMLPKRKAKETPMITEDKSMLNCLDGFKRPPLPEKLYGLDLEKQGEKRKQENDPARKKMKETFREVRIYK